MLPVGNETLNKLVPGTSPLQQLETFAKLDTLHMSSVTSAPSAPSGLLIVIVQGDMSPRLSIFKSYPSLRAYCRVWRGEHNVSYTMAPASIAVPSIPKITAMSKRAPNTSKFRTRSVSQSKRSHPSSALGHTTRRHGLRASIRSRCDTNYGSYRDKRRFTVP